MIKFSQDFETAGAFNHVKGDDTIKELRLRSCMSAAVPKLYFGDLKFAIKLEICL